MSQLSDRIRARRVELGLTLQELADRVEISKTYMWDLEQDADGISAKVLGALATALGVSLQELYSGPALGTNVEPQRYEALARIRENIKEARRFIRGQPWYVEAALDAAVFDLFVLMGRVPEKEVEL